jgi:hypothetical protein
MDWRLAHTTRLHDAGSTQCNTGGRLDRSLQRSTSVAARASTSSAYRFQPSAPMCALNSAAILKDDGGDCCLVAALQLSLRAESRCASPTVTALVLHAVSHASSPSRLFKAAAHRTT